MPRIILDFDPVFENHIDSFANPDLSRREAVSSKFRNEAN